jgi:hypothetical protein
LRLGSAAAAAAVVAIGTVAFFSFGGLGFGGSSVDEGISKAVLAAQSDVFEQKWWDVPCRKQPSGPLMPGCTPVKRCGRFLTDTAFNDADITTLSKMAQKWMKLGGATGGPTILDLHSGALSYKDKFIDMYQAANNAKEEYGVEIYDEEDFNVYKKVKDEVKTAVEEAFGVKRELVFLTSPTFFSKINDREAVTEHDEYWHEHVDKITYGSFDFTCLLYLTDHGTDFEGGEFLFLNKSGFEEEVHPRRGRLSCFTSGTENVHRIKKVTGGTRFALTVAFSCDPKAGIDDPNGRKAVASASVPK